MRYYWIDFYLRAEDINPDKVVAATNQALLDYGCRFRSFNSGPGRGRRRTSYTTGLSLAVADLKDLLTTTTDFELGRITLYYRYDFEFDPETLKVMTRRDKNEATEVSVRFDVQDDIHFGRKVTVSMHTYEEFVLNLWEEHVFPSHRANKQRVINLIEKIYESVSPFFVWADYETNSVDFTYEELTNEYGRIRNNLIIIGPKLLPKLKSEDIKKELTEGKKLADGGIRIGGEFCWGDPGLSKIAVQIVFPPDS